MTPAGDTFSHLRLTLLALLWSPSGPRVFRFLPAPTSAQLKSVNRCPSGIKNGPTTIKERRAKTRESSGDEMIRRVTEYVIVCDADRIMTTECQSIGGTAFNSQTMAECAESAKQDGWHQVSKRLWLCPYCTKRLNDALK